MNNENTTAITTGERAYIRRDRFPCYLLYAKIDGTCKWTDRYSDARDFLLVEDAEAYIDHTKIKGDISIVHISEKNTAEAKDKRIAELEAENKALKTTAEILINERSSYTKTAHETYATMQKKMDSLKAKADMLEECLTNISILRDTDIDKSGADNLNTAESLLMAVVGEALGALEQAKELTE